MSMLDYSHMSIIGTFDRTKVPGKIQKQQATAGSCGGTLRGQGEDSAIKFLHYIIGTGAVFVHVFSFILFMH